jgi:tetratricopeptide (TPR) repeat protein
MLLVALTVTAAAEPAIPAQKLASDGYPDQARQDFIEGLIAERAGNIAGALQKYTASNGKSPQANTIFNIARLELQLDRVPDARTHFTKYLELAPEAADHAAIEKLVAELEKADPVITIGGRVDGYLDSEPVGIVLVDGVRVGASPVTMTVKPGAHEVERITATTYVRSTITAKTGERDYVDLRGRKHAGNVVVAGKRVELAPGHHSLPDVACTPVEFDVAEGSHITYVRVELADRAQGKDCRELRQVSTQKLVIGK